MLPLLFQVLKVVLAARAALIALGVLVFGATSWTANAQNNARDSTQDIDLPLALEPAPNVVLSRNEAGFDAANRGAKLFAKVWVTDILGTAHDFDGLGPLFTARSCLECHQGGYRGRAVGQQSIAPGALVVNQDALGTQFGRQFQDRGVLFKEPEVVIASGAPHWPGHHRALSTDLFARRVAPSLTTLALISALSDQQILLGADPDPDDHNSDGIAGRVGRTRNGAVGRFGWKADQASLESQIIIAFAQDLGVESNELQPSHVQDLSAYLTQLVPPSLTAPPQSFDDFGCAACHVANNGLYSDLLLHDLGAGLADPFGDAPQRWRTAPLADLRDAFAQQSFLHDGRARTVDQAVAWHGGEALAAVTAWRSSRLVERDRIVNWLQGADIVAQPSAKDRLEQP